MSTIVHKVLLLYTLLFKRAKFESIFDSIIRQVKLYLTPPINKNNTKYPLYISSINKYISTISINITILQY